jgi:hypothetical protein
MAYTKSESRKQMRRECRKIKSSMTSGFKSRFQLRESDRLDKRTVRQMKSIIVSRQRNYDRDSKYDYVSSPLDDMGEGL